VAVRVRPEAPLKDCSVFENFKEKPN